LKQKSKQKQTKQAKNCLLPAVCVCHTFFYIVLPGIKIKGYINSCGANTNFNDCPELPPPKKILVVPIRPQLA